MGIAVKKRFTNYAGRNFQRTRTADKQTALSRSSQMSKIRSRDTKFERDFIARLTSEINVPFETHVRALKGTPDLVFQDQKVCVFLDSDFWHGWQFPRWKHLLKNEFWREKISNNRKRDARITTFLRRKGWRVIRIWEHEIKIDLNKAIIKISIALLPLNEP